MKRLSQLSRASNCILCHLYRFLSSWTSSILGQIGQCALFFRALERRICSGENAVDRITPLTRTDIKSWTSLILGQIKFQSYPSIDWSYLPLSTGRNALYTIAPVFLIGSSSNLQVTRTDIKKMKEFEFQPYPSRRY